ncbi:enoyl-CoA hydratase [Pseudomaricurvus alkylphenolicus]|uniref:enoyl-CoA hydratase/isomerase family protein n=1 Tax=Pseudomaricurvus alkylphenolicus TaxID=1306991 RepID=UPI00141DBB45|nr:enoyl-CoA hydratase-related protein [Pseudomaricurvus alkylphenolicus]NIB42487.1 enoyl-CoA hydratase [Pseudomaricurvus alkylphenolicus]
MPLVDYSLDADGIATVYLNRSDVLNVLNPELMTEMKLLLSDLAENPEVRALVITGKGKGFCAGADLTAVDPETLERGRLGKWVSDSMLHHFNPMMIQIYEFPKPVISAINGIAAGGGAGLALCADLVIAARSAAIKVVQVPQLGIVADLGANWLLPRLSGRGRALGACLLGDTLDAQTLEQWGLVWECVDDDELLHKARERAVKLASVPANTITQTRRLIDSAAQSTFNDMLEQERLVQEELCDQDHFGQQVQRFLNRPER